MIARADKDFDVDVALHVYTYTTVDETKHIN